MLFTDGLTLSASVSLCCDIFVSQSTFLSSVSSVSVRSMSGIWERRNHVSTPTPELNLPIFIKDTYCQLSKVEDRNFNPS